ncbi:SusC/RagA family TonB-linked outer membrane protein [Sphingobacterium corticibacterium]|uniref:TonB-dependent receptor n=1 Tax=Sphingobacterium corticibacterium TaxID=2484746 RepID=A0A4Q6XPK9_9SPHI|nr:TonB-dependent receptor [Sphingobacterium corticibacterium]RZF61635.1 TonB-dependent receptor [Sphingobacterium corticibacterium]
MNIKMYKRRWIGFIIFLTTLFLGIEYGYAQQRVQVTGVARDTVAGLPNITIREVNQSTNMVASDNFGRFSIQANRNGTLEFSATGMKTTRVDLTNRSPRSDGTFELDIVMEYDDFQIEEIAVTGFGGTQRKESLVSSITSVNVKDLQTPSSNLTNAFAGRVAGMIAFQTSGEPGIGTDNSTFYIRGLSTTGTGKVDPLILIDGVESGPTDLARLQPDDIESFSVLRDAAASSIYGARGANGVVLVNTKKGKEGATQFFFRAENRISSNTRNLKFSDNITFMRMANEAALTRTPNASQPYTENKIRSTIAGDDPYLFANNDWTDLMIKDYTMNQGFNMNISGGTQRARYYISGTYNVDNGILKTDPVNNFNNNIKLRNYSLRSNVDIRLTPSTDLAVILYGQFDDYSGPLHGGSEHFSNAMRANPVLFPVQYPSSMLPYAEHTLFGGAQGFTTGLSMTNELFLNPYAEMVKGFRTHKSSNIMPQLELKQDFGKWIPGLRARAMGYIRRTSQFSVERQFNPFYYMPLVNANTGDYSIYVLNHGQAGSIGPVGTEYLNFNNTPRNVGSRTWLEGTVNYNYLFNEKHDVGGTLIGYINNYENPNEDSLIKALPGRNLGVSGRFTYAYASKYMAEFNFGYNGSERFHERYRMGFFPSGGIGWRISEENFFEPLRKYISSLKFRATYGQAGNDEIASIDQRFFYMSQINMNDGLYGAQFGRGDGAPMFGSSGISIGRYANPNITWETSTQLNVGMDLNIRSFELIADVFHQKRTNILQQISALDNTAGLMAPMWTNYGQTESKGLDLQFSFFKPVSSNFSFGMRGTATYSVSKVLQHDELPYGSDLRHLSKVGQSIGQQWGLIAERLFIDDAEVANSPVQFGDVNLRAGDIKYRDINGDGVINDFDFVPVGHNSQPQLIYGFGGTFQYKNFDFGYFFQGSALYSFFIDAQAMQPFRRYVPQDRSFLAETRLVESIANDYWSESNPNPYAFWPRLSTYEVGSNQHNSTWWLRNGNFLRLKNIEAGYNFNNLERFKVKGARLYFSAQNLFVISRFKMWDPEMGGNGLGYPLQALYNVGFTLNF